MYICICTVQKYSLYIHKVGHDSIYWYDTLAQPAKPPNPKPNSPHPKAGKGRYLHALHCIHGTVRYSTGTSMHHPCTHTHTLTYIHTYIHVLYLGSSSLPSFLPSFLPFHTSSSLASLPPFLFPPGNLEPNCSPKKPCSRCST